jgi:hypothetical protein
MFGWQLTVILEKLSAVMSEIELVSLLVSYGDLCLVSIDNGPSLIRIFGKHT